MHPDTLQVDIRYLDLIVMRIFIVLFAQGYPAKRTLHYTEDKWHFSILGHTGPTSFFFFVFFFFFFFFFGGGRGLMSFARGTRAPIYLPC